MTEGSAHLHPLLTHHIVNSLGWPSLRPVQRRTVEPLTRGENTLIIAPTAGGKTEAAFFPLVSRMLTEDWRGLSLLYLCPLRALLNNLYPRLRGYAELVGRRVGLWHGDVGESERQRVRSDPPDVLLTTPESVEAMLISSRTDHSWLFRNAQAVVVDEIHAFAGDDRGWHLLAVTQRLQRLASRDLQRVGLSATVGEPEALLAWFVRGSQRPAVLLDGCVRDDAEDEVPEVIVDHVGSIGNAATVISRLHTGEKRLVFVDSRARAEELTHELRLREATTWLSHGSLGRRERADAEEAFATAPSGVIVATSTMELGIDVGGLDRVIQLDAPWTVAGFLQRLGRTGRRRGARANCLILTTNDRALPAALGLLAAWSDGWIEPVEPPATPLHLAVHQLLALLRQEGVLARDAWRGWLGDPSVLGADVDARFPDVIAYLIATDVLSTDGPLLQLGPEGEKRYGRRNFMDLTAVFSDPPTLSVVHGQHTIGKIHVEALLRIPQDDAPTLLVAGRSWSIAHVDWTRRRVLVEPTPGGGKTAWVGGMPGLSYELAQRTRGVLRGDDPAGVRLSDRAEGRIAEIREQFRWLPEDGTSLVTDSAGATWWWTFAGAAANEELAARLGRPTARGGTSPLAIRVDGLAVEDITVLSPDETLELPDDVELAWKFADALPRHVLTELWSARARDETAVQAVLDGAIQNVRLNTPGPRP